MTKPLSDPTTKGPKPDSEIQSLLLANATSLGASSTGAPLETRTSTSAEAADLVSGDEEEKEAARELESTSMPPSSSSLPSSSLSSLSPHIVVLDEHSRVHMDSKTEIITVTNLLTQETAVYRQGDDVRFDVSSFEPPSDIVLDTLNAGDGAKTANASSDQSILSANSDSNDGEKRQEQERASLDSGDESSTSNPMEWGHIACALWLNARHGGGAFVDVNKYVATACVLCVCMLCMRSVGCISLSVQIRCRSVADSWHALLSYSGQVL